VANELGWENMEYEMQSNDGGVEKKWKEKNKVTKNSTSISGSSDAKSLNNFKDNKP